jgi:hypothetical protein
VQPFADDIKAELSADKVILTRPGGLTLSDAAAAQQEKAARAVIFDTKRWNDDRQAEYARRQFELVRAAAEAPVTGRTEARLDLARFYFSRQMYSEAKSVLDTAIADERPPLKIRRRSFCAPSPTSWVASKRRKRISPIRPSAIGTMRRCGARAPSPVRPNGRRRSTPSATSARSASPLGAADS